MNWMVWFSLSGRYEGIDERLVSAEVDEEISIGDYVLSGGELPAMVFDGCADTSDSGCSRRLTSRRSRNHLRTDCWIVRTTRDRKLLPGSRFPDVLLSGNHAAILRWRRKQSLGRTWQRRPEMIEKQVRRADDLGFAQGVSSMSRRILRAAWAASRRLDLKLGR